MSLRPQPAKTPLSVHCFLRSSSTSRGGQAFRTGWLALIASTLGFGLFQVSPLLALPGTPGVKPTGTPGPAASSPSGIPIQSLQRGGQVTIESDQQQADNVSGVITAIGNVRIIYPDRGMVATARQAQYFTREGRLVLSGDVDVVDREGQRLRADQIVYLLNGQRLIALPAKGQQVQTRLRFDTKAGAMAPQPLLP